MISGRGGAGGTFVPIGISVGGRGGVPNLSFVSTDGMAVKVCLTIDLKVFSFVGVFVVELIGMVVSAVVSLSKYKPLKSWHL